jgi:hypothetical protein
MPQDSTTGSGQKTTKYPTTQDTCVETGGTQCPDKTPPTTSLRDGAYQYAASSVVASI